MINRCYFGILQLSRQAPGLSIERSTTCRGSLLVLDQLPLRELEYERGYARYLCLVGHTYSSIIWSHLLSSIALPRTDQIKAC